MGVYLLQLFWIPTPCRVMRFLRSTDNVDDRWLCFTELICPLLGHEATKRLFIHWLVIVYYSLTNSLCFICIWTGIFTKSKVSTLFWVPCPKHTKHPSYPALIARWIVWSWPCYGYMCHGTWLRLPWWINNLPCYYRKIMPIISGPIPGEESQPWLQDSPDGWDPRCQATFLVSCCCPLAVPSIPRSTCWSTETGWID